MAHVSTPSSSSPPTADVAVDLRVAIARIYRSLRASADHRVTPSQSSALARIGQAGPLRLGALAQLEGIAPATMSKVVDSLEVQGLVERTPDVADGRASLVTLSADGTSLLDHLRSSSTAALDRALITLDVDELDLLRQTLPVLEKVSSHLQADVAKS